MSINLSNVLVGYLILGLSILAGLSDAVNFFSLLFTYLFIYFVSSLVVSIH